MAIFWNFLENLRSFPVSTNFAKEFKNINLYHKDSGPEIESQRKTVTRWCIDLTFPDSSCIQTVYTWQTQSIIISMLFKIQI